MNIKYNDEIINSFSFVELQTLKTKEKVKEKVKEKPIYEYSCAYCINDKMTKKEIKGINKIFRISNEPCQSCITNQRLSHYI
jgi:hypothetical protein